ncbi:hypothetical protein GMA11_07105 [Granulicatella sp. zg-ZJ]|uniref:recombinase family protein n=1 Tax=Granulicatella sp. zg-ZJ TaxID=2678504 RepID=UPI0013D5199E|nr:recombinase family protein [Granulicatella sp. zg-ZJ]NEW62314.1 hypothetical protein [Granulicatella sp. zg-ZJ]NEW63160.1 hypothetical protein [Granulicatella sp. zg-ZJ]
MKHLPLGYKVSEGTIIVDEDTANQVRLLYHYYIEGNALEKAARMAGVLGYHGTISRILSNKKYIGHMNYPSIIDTDTFEHAQQKRKDNAKRLGRDKFQPKQKKRVIHTSFYSKENERQYENPFKHAEYLYSLISVQE